MNIVCVAACTAGIAHTYIAREKLIKGAKALGHTIKVETQGTIGTENELQAADISAADVVILAVDQRKRILCSIIHVRCGKMPIFGFTDAWDSWGPIRRRILT